MNLQQKVEYSNVQRTQKRRGNVFEHQNAPCPSPIKLHLNNCKIFCRKFSWINFVIVDWTALTGPLLWRAHIFSSPTRWSAGWSFTRNSQPKTIDIFRSETAPDAQSLSWSVTRSVTTACQLTCRHSRTPTQMIVQKIVIAFVVTHDTKDRT